MFPFHSHLNSKTMILLVFITFIIQYSEQCKEPCAYDNDGFWSIAFLSAKDVKNGPMFVNDLLSTQRIKIHKNSSFSDSSKNQFIPSAITCSTASSPLKDGTQGAPMSYVADPFLFIPPHFSRSLGSVGYTTAGIIPDINRANGQVIFSFYEMKNTCIMRGEIGTAFSVDRGLTWVHLGTALTANVHLSYPFIVFDETAGDGIEDGEVVMFPQSNPLMTSLKSFLGGQHVYVTKPSLFPFGWQHVATPLSGGKFADASPVLYKGTWYVWITEINHKPKLKYELRLFIIEGRTLSTGTWREHPRSPLTSDMRHARMGGRPVIFNKQLLRPAQDCSRGYGMSVIWMSVDLLTPTEYKESVHSEVLPGVLRLKPSQHNPLQSNDRSNSHNNNNNSSSNNRDATKSISNKNKVDDGDNELNVPTYRIHHIDAQEAAPGEWLALVDGEGFHGVHRHGQGHTVQEQKELLARTRSYSSKAAAAASSSINSSSSSATTTSSSSLATANRASSVVAVEASEAVGSSPSSTITKPQVTLIANNVSSGTSELSYLEVMLSLLVFCSVLIWYFRKQLFSDRHNNSSSSSSSSWVGVREKAVYGHGWKGVLHMLNCTNICMCFHERIPLIVLAVIQLAIIGYVSFVTAYALIDGPLKAWGLGSIVGGYYIWIPEKYYEHRTEKTSFIPTGSPYALKKLYIVTAVSSQYYPRVLNFIGSMHTFEPKYAVYVYDIGLTSVERRHLACLKNVHLIDFDFNQYPPHVGENLGNFAWKILIINHFMDNYVAAGEGVLCLDSGLEVASPFLHLVHAKMITYGHFSVTQSLIQHGPEGWGKLLTDKTVLKLYGNVDNPEGTRFCAGGFQGFIKNSMAHEQILKEAKKCALLNECISVFPVDDQGVFTALIRKNGFICERKDIFLQNRIEKLLPDVTVASPYYKVIARRARLPLLFKKEIQYNKTCNIIPTDALPPFTASSTHIRKERPVDRNDQYKNRIMDLKFHNYKVAKEEVGLTRASSVVFSYGFLIVFAVLVVGMNKVLTYYYSKQRLYRQQQRHKGDDNKSAGAIHNSSEEEEDDDESTNLLEEITNLLKGTNNNTTSTAPVSSSSATATITHSHKRSDQRSLRLSQFRSLLLKIFFSVAVLMLSVMYAQFHRQVFM